MLESKRAHQGGQRGRLLSIRVEVSRRDPLDMAPRYLTRVTLSQLQTAVPKE
jgi:hypothetical protein